MRLTTLSNAIELNNNNNNMNQCAQTSGGMVPKLKSRGHRNGSDTNQRSIKSVNLTISFNESIQHQAIIRTIGGHRRDIGKQKGPLISTLPIVKEWMFDQSKSVLWQQFEWFRQNQLPSRCRRCTIGSIGEKTINASIGQQLSKFLWCCHRQNLFTSLLER